MTRMRPDIDRIRRERDENDSNDVGLGLLILEIGFASLASESLTTRLEGSEAKTGCH